MTREASPPQSSPAPNNTFAALRHANFRIYFAGQLVSISGTWMQRVAQGWLVYQLTESELWLGVVAFAAGIPALLLSPLAGALADRFSRRALLAGSYALEMVIALWIGLLALHETVTVTHLLLAALGLGITGALNEPTRQAFMRDLVGRDDLNSGIAVNAIMANAGAIIGPALAGLLLAEIGASWCFILNGLSFSAVIVSLAFIKPLRNTPPAGGQRIWGQMVEGLAFVRRHATIGPMLLLQALVNVFGIHLLLTQLPAFADNALNAPTAGYSALTAALGVGSLLGSLGNVRLGARYGRGPLVTGLTLLLPVLMLMLVGVSLLTVSVPLAALLTLLLGAAYTTFFVTVNILIQVQAPDDYMGRVTSLYAMNRFGVAPVGALALGLIAGWIGVEATYVVCNLLLLMTGAFIVTRSRDLRLLA